MNNKRLLWQSPDFSLCVGSELFSLVILGLWRMTFVTQSQPMTCTETMWFSCKFYYSVNLKVFFPEIRQKEIKIHLCNKLQTPGSINMANCSSPSPWSSYKTFWKIPCGLVFVLYRAVEDREEQEEEGRGGGDWLTWSQLCSVLIKTYNPFICSFKDCMVDGRQRSDSNEQQI